MPTISIPTIITELSPSTQFHLGPNAHRALSVPSLDPFFVDPQVTPLEEVVEWTSPIVIVGAPGAVGKTALARHIAASKDYVLWDLSQIKLGDNSFVGTLAQSFGPQVLPKVLTALTEGKIGFVFDAFDEAEMLSGWPRIEDFLTEIWEYAKELTKPALVFLARSETASYISMFLETLGATTSKQPFVLVEIDYFNQEESLSFVELQVQRIARDKNDDALADRYFRYTVPFREAVNSIFRSIYEAFSVQAETAWNDMALRSFLGYAPVLQAIAAFIANYTNFQDVQQNVTDILSGERSKIATAIMTDLLKREQQKVITALQGKGLPHAAEWRGWDTLYTPEEQIRKILLHVTGSSSELIPDDSVPPWLTEAYLGSLQTFLPQHPFIRESSFAGPAFRDYTLSHLLTHALDYRQQSLGYMDQPNYVPSQLLINFYKNDSGELVYGEDIGFLYESFSARDTVKDLTSATIISPCDSVDSDLHRFELFDESATDLEGHDPIIMYIRGDANPAISFRRKLRNASIHFKGTVALGNSKHDFEISDSEVYCNKIQLKTSSFIAQSIFNTHFVHIEADEYDQIPSTISVDVRGPGSLQIHWPGGKQYPWALYYVEGTIEHEDLSVENAFLALRRILSWFRRDRREDLARHKDLINNAAVAQSEIRNRMLEFLIAEKILYEEGYLFKVDVQVLTNAGINFTDMKSVNITADIREFLERFIQA